MKIEYLHASKFGNGVIVAAEFKRQIPAKDVVVDVVSETRIPDPMRGDRRQPAGARTSQSPASTRSEHPI